MDDKAFIAEMFPSMNGAATSTAPSASSSTAQPAGNADPVVAQMFPSMLTAEPQAAQSFNPALFPDLFKDEEIGGTKLQASQALALEVVQRFGTDELRNALENPELGNNPEIVRLLVRVGAELQKGKR